MLESTLLFKLGLFLVAIIVFQIIIKASIQAWQNRGLSLTQSDQAWGWWVELHTTQPDYTYYFGPFSSTGQAERSKLGYIQDLESENAKGITAKVLWCKPKQLTSFSDESSEMSWSV